jgi:hypothetical protein
MGASSQRSRPPALFWIVLLAIAAVGIEGGAYLFELLSPRVLDEPIRRRSAILREQSARIAELLDSTQDRRQILDPVLGWRYRAGYTSATDRLNAQGLRGRREYDPVPGPHALRVAAFGDSFVYGSEVRDDDAWTALLEAGSGRIEALNYGVGGFGLDQAFLRFQIEGMALRPDVVLIGFAPDDLRRIVNVYRRFISSHEWPLAKPRFVLRGDSLVTVPNPLPRHEDYRQLLQHPAAVRNLGKLDSWYSQTIYEHPLYDAVATLRVGHALWQRVQRRVLDPNRLVRSGVFNERSAAFLLQVAVARAFVAAVRDRHVIPAVLLLPDRGSVARVREGGPAVYAPLAAALRAAGVDVWDAAAAFRSAPTTVDELFASGGHYSPAGNRVLAEWLRDKLRGVHVLRHAGATGRKGSPPAAEDARDP